MSDFLRPERPTLGDLIPAQSVAGMLGCSVRTVHRLRDAGKMPAPVQISGRLVRWRRADVEAWISAGCPADRPAKSRV
jgi:excisionase family DNA binding protein